MDLIPPSLRRAVRFAENNSFLAWSDKCIKKAIYKHGEEVDQMLTGLGGGIYVVSRRWAGWWPFILPLLPTAKCLSIFAIKFSLAVMPLMSAVKGGKSASECLRPRARRTFVVTTSTVSSNSITRIAADRSTSDYCLWTRDRRDCVGDVLETLGIVGE